MSIRLGTSALLLGVLSSLSFLTMEPSASAQPALKPPVAVKPPQQTKPFYQKPPVKTPGIGNLKNPGPGNIPVRLPVKPVGNGAPKLPINPNMGPRSPQGNLNLPGNRLRSLTNTEGGNNPPEDTTCPKERSRQEGAAGGASENTGCKKGSGNGNCNNGNSGGNTGGGGETGGGANPGPVPGIQGPNGLGHYGPFATIRRALEVVRMFQNMGYPNTIQFHNGDGQYVLPRR